jgi:hypothetical protein
MANPLASMIASPLACPFASPLQQPSTLPLRYRLLTVPAHPTSPILPLSLLPRAIPLSSSRL